MSAPVKILVDVDDLEVLLDDAEGCLDPKVRSEYRSAIEKARRAR